MRIDAALTCNLQELYGLQQAKNSSYYEVVPSLWGHKIYYSEAGWGKVLKIIYAVWAFFFGSKHVTAKLRKSIRYTQKTFEVHLRSLEKHFTNYQSLLVDLLEEYRDFDAKSYAEEHWIVTKWMDSTVPFIQLFERGKVDKIDQLFKRLTGREASGPSSVFKQIPNYHKILNYQKIIDVVRQVPLKPPLAALKKLSWKKELFQEEEKALKAWIEGIHALGNQMKVKTFHAGMTALVKHVEFMHRTNYQKKPRVDDLELELAKYGLNLFRQKDPKHMKWCDSLKKPGVVLDIRGKKYPIEKELYSGKFDNKLRVFTVEKNPNKVIIVGQNRVILSLKKRGAQDYSWGIRPVHWFEVSSDGRFAVAERLKIRLSKRSWLSGDNLDIKDILLLKPVVDQIAWFIEQKGTPKNLDSSYLMYDRMNSLKSTKTLVQGEFDYPKLIEFCRTCSNGNPTVYNFLIKESGLLSHTYHSYFKEVIKRTLEGTDDLAEDIGALRQFQITDHYVIEQGTAFQKEVNRLQNECTQHLLEKYKIEEPLIAAKEIAKQMLCEYREKNMICSLWPKMKKRVVATTVKSLKLTDSKDDDDLI